MHVVMTPRKWHPCNKHMRPRFISINAPPLIRKGLLDRFYTILIIIALIINIKTYKAGVYPILLYSNDPDSDLPCVFDSTESSYTRPVNFKPTFHKNFKNRNMHINIHHRKTMLLYIMYHEG
ncbi:hypothetical protein YC2023_047320 [Brassica napus]